MRCIKENDAADYVGGDGGRERSRKIAAHIADCERCGNLVQEMEKIAKSLGPLSGEFDAPSANENIMSLIRMGRGEPEQLPRMAPPKRTVKWASIAAACVLPFLFFLIAQGRIAPLDNPAETENKMQGVAPRGGAPSEDAWVSLEIFSRDDGTSNAVYRPLGKTIAPDAAVAVAYEDRSEHLYDYLMVFAVDSSGRIFWYYPAHEDARKNPVGIPIGRKTGRVILPDEIVHDLAAGPLRFFGLFSRRPLDIRSVEEKISRQVGKSGGITALKRLQFEGTGQWSRTISVTAERK